VEHPIIPRLKGRSSGTTKKGGHPATRLETNQDPSYHALWFDDSSGLLIGVGHYWMLKDYTAFDGVQIPQVIELSRKGGTIIFKVDSVEHNRLIPNTFLERPTVVSGS
jgi:hypothetical protein